MLPLTGRFVYWAPSAPPDFRGKTLRENGLVWSEILALTPSKISEKFIMESYWDLYVAYVNKCVADNWANGVDPAHYEMEWNHFLPKCAFGDWPIGQWLTLPQHSVASCLQSIALKKNCHCPWHKKYVSEELWELSVESSREDRVGICKKAAKVAVESKSGIHGATADQLSEWGSKGGKKAGQSNVENRTGFCGATPEQLSDWGSRGAQTTVEKGIGVHGATSEQRREWGLRGARIGSTKKWEDPDHPELGKHNAGNLVRMQKRRGLPHGKKNRRCVNA